MTNLPWGHRPDIQAKLIEKTPNDEKAEWLYKRIKEYESMANDSYSKPMPCTINDIIEFLEDYDGNEKGESVRT